MKRMKKAGLVATSMATIAVCSSLIVGSTYALFTSEDNVNIAVTAGKVSVVAEVGDLTATTTLDASYEVTGKEVALQNGGSASVSGNSIVLNKVTPGDTVSFPVTVTNSSNVSTLCRLSYKVESGLLLASGLTVEVGEYDLTGKQEYATGWINLETTTYNVTVSLPWEAGNLYQGLNTEISIAVEAVQANGAVEGEGVVDVDLPDFSAAKEASANGSLAVVDNAEGLSAALANGGYVLLANDVEVTSLKDGNNHYPAGTVVDGNGNKITDAKGNLSASKEVEYRNIVFDIDGGWHGVITNSAKFYNCTFDGTTPYITPTASDIVFDGCTFIDTILQICYNEGQKIDPATINTTITNNTFIVNNTSTGSHAMVLGGGTADFWANGAETVTVSGNTFNSRYASSYIAYYIYGSETLTALPLYIDNTYNGDAYYAMNGVALDDQHEIKLTEGVWVGGKVYETLAEGIAALKDGDTLVLAEGTYAPTANEQLKITADNVTIKGAGEATVIDCGAYSVSGQAGLFIGGNNVTVKDLTVKSSAGGNISAIKASNYNFGEVDIKNVVIENVTVESLGHGVNLHGVAGATVNNVNVASYGKCGISVARATGVVITNCTTVAGGWADIGCMYGSSGSYETPSSITLGEGNVLGNGLVYSERPASANEGADKVSYPEGWTLTVAENGTWALTK